ncbi:glycosyltransferase family 4 protein [Psychrobacter faecalis]|uniref:glycosyltransferase family 4 protein n=1 Tax=Psychrobacter faecalis TaxID=180588 RepID=UPI003FD3421B
MKKVCFLIGNLDNSGGTERVTTLIANELVKLSYNVSIISLTGGKKPFFELDDSIRTYSLYSDKVSFKTNFFGVVYKLRNFVKNNKIDSFVVVDSISCIFTVPALYGLKINHICWEHFNFNVNLGVKSRDLGRRLAARYCNYVVTLTERDKELWEQGLVNIRAKIVSIANPTPYENMNHIPSLEYKTVLAIGRLTYQKGFDLLIDAWALVCETNFDWTLRIVGSGEDEENLKKQAQSLGIENRIDFVSATKNVEQYFKTSSLYCLSSRFEGFGLVMIEAQSFGLPIVAFNCDVGPADIITNEVNGFLCAVEDISSLSEKILEFIILDKEVYRTFSSEAKESAKRFEIKNIILNWNIL